MSTFPLVPCPRCKSSLVSVDGGVDGWCANCGAILVTPKRPSTAQLSRKACVSVALGVCSIVGMFVTAIPAIVIGYYALREIDARPNEVRGKVVAWSGILSALILGLCCAPFLASLGLQVATAVRSRVQSNEAEEVLNIAGELGLEPPARLVPRSGVHNPVFKERYVVFVDEDEEQFRQQNLFVYERRDRALPETVKSTVEEMLDKRQQPYGGAEVVEMRPVEVEGFDIETEFYIQNANNRPHEIRFCQFEAGGALFAVYWRVAKPKAEEAEQREADFQRLIAGLAAKAVEPTGNP